MTVEIPNQYTRTIRKIAKDNSITTEQVLGRTISLLQILEEEREDNKDKKINVGLVDGDSEETICSFNGI